MPHGLSNALVLAPVLRFHMREAAPLYAELGVAIGVAKAGDPVEAAAQAFVTAMSALVADMPFEQNLRAVGVAKNDIAMLADDAFKVQRLLVNNPREVTLADAAALYEEVF